MALLRRCEDSATVMIPNIHIHIHSVTARYTLRGSTTAVVHQYVLQLQTLMRVAKRLGGSIEVVKFAPLLYVNSTIQYIPAPSECPVRSNE